MNVSNLLEDHTGGKGATATKTFIATKLLAVCGCQSVWEGSGSGYLQIQVNGSWITCTNDNGYMVVSNNYNGDIRTGTKLVQWINNKTYKDTQITGARFIGGWDDGSSGVIAIKV